MIDATQSLLTLLALMFGSVGVFVGVLAWLVHRATEVRP